MHGSMNIKINRNLGKQNFFGTEKQKMYDTFFWTYTQFMHAKTYGANNHPSAVSDEVYETSF